MEITKGKIYILIIIFLIAVIGGNIGGRMGQKEAEYRAKEKVIEDLQRSLEFEKREPFSLKQFIFG